MTDDRVVMADAELTGELTDARRAGLLSEAVERRARQIKKERVERLVDHIARIVLEIVQICCARRDIRLHHALAVLPEFTVREIVKLQADEKGIFEGERARKTRHRVVIPGFGDRELHAAQRTRDQRRWRIVQMKYLPEPPAKGARLCHVG